MGTILSDHSLLFLLCLMIPPLSSTLGCCNSFGFQQTRLSRGISSSSSIRRLPWIHQLQSTLEKSSAGLTNQDSNNDDDADSQQQQSLRPGTASLGDTSWEELGFEFRPTRSHLRMVYSDNAWHEPELVRGPPYLQLHIGATALHYGQSCFEGLKAFCHADHTVHLFCPAENAMRMQSSCRRTLMADLPTDLFVQTCQQVVRDNLDYVPPYGSNGALYIRPLLFGSGPRIGLQPSDEYTFVCMVIPVGDYYKGGLSKPVQGTLILDFDRAAPRGVGHVKVAGNYAADLLPNMRSKQAGYPIGLYLDAATQTKIEEFSTSNFVGILYNHDNNPNNHNNNTTTASGAEITYVTPQSPSILPSITNKALMQVAKDLGFHVEQREVLLEELAHFDEVFAVGTAVVLTPVGSITVHDHDHDDENDNGKTKKPTTTTWSFGANPDEIGPVTRQLYDHVRAIQKGEREDKHGWNVKV